MRDLAKLLELKKWNWLRNAAAATIANVTAASFLRCQSN